MALQTQWELIGALARYVARRREHHDDDIHPLAYGRGVHTRAVALFSVSMGLVVVVEVLVPWLWLEVPLVLVGAYGGVLAAGLLAAHHARPHLLGPNRLHLRDPFSLDAIVPVDHLHGVSVRVARAGTERPRVFSDALVVPVAGQTNLAIELDPGVAVDVDGTSQVVRQVLCWVDGPDEAVELLASATWGAAGDP